MEERLGTPMLAKGAPITWVSWQLGHASVQTTLGFYSWALPQGDNKLASLLDPVTTGDQYASGRMNEHA